MGHILLTGRRGLGKTTFGTCVAQKMGVSHLIVSAKAITTLAQLNNLFIKNLPEILIIDEIHRIDPAFSDMIHQAMDSFKYSYADEDEVMRTATLHPFTLIGCTTSSGKLTLPFVSRFPKKFQLQPYSRSELTKIIENVCKNNNINIDNTAAREIAKRATHNPRNALSHLENIYEYAIEKNHGVISHDVAVKTFALHDIDSLGLGIVQREILTILSQSKSKMGIANLANRINEDIDTLIEQHEPDLLDLGFIERTNSGRKITMAGLKHLQSLI